MAEVLASNPRALRSCGLAHLLMVLGGKRPSSRRDAIIKLFVRSKSRRNLGSTVYVSTPEQKYIFTARITAEIRRDDGIDSTREFEIEARLGGQTHRLVVAAAQFDGPVQGSSKLQSERLENPIALAA